MHQRKDGRWEDTVFINGKRKHFYGLTKSEVKKKMAAYTEAVQHGPTVSDALDSWLEYKEDKVSPKTYEGYKAPAARIKSTLGSQYCRELSPAQVQAFVNGVAAQGFKRTSVQRPLDILRMLFDWLITTDSGVVVNPCVAVRLPSGLKQERRELISREDVDRIKAGVSLPFGLFAFLLMYTGLRKGEALALTDADFSDGSISVSKSLSWINNRPTIKQPKTAAGVRSVPVLSPLRAVLPKWKGYLFSADGGRAPLTETEFRSRWEGYCKAAGLCDVQIIEHKSSGQNNRDYVREECTPRIVPHQLRHEFATLCLDAGLDAADTQEIMGHASISTTQATYQHITESRRVKSTSKLEQYLVPKKE